MNETEARKWCTAMALDLRYQDIRPEGAPYLRRYFVAGWVPGAAPGPAVYLHHFVSSDPADALHSHPWAWGLSLILCGGYTETRLEHDALVKRTFEPGATNSIKPNDKHRIELLGADCWTLFLAGEYAQPWAFYPFVKGA
jgi:hypothetical protein